MRENAVFTHNGIRFVMHFTRVLPYKIAHLRHVVARSFIIRCSLQFCSIFEEMRQATEVAGGDRGHPVHRIFIMYCLFLLLL